MVYEAAEDTHLLISTLPASMQGLSVLEIGCGNGLISVTAALRGAQVTAVDIDEQALHTTKHLAEHNKANIELLHGDMFRPIKERTFDIIISNPPYLPNESLDPDIALDGGPQGWEWIEKFLAKVGSYLKDDGKIILLYSNRTNTEQVHKLIFDHGFMRKELAKKAVGLSEELYVDELTHYLARGKRGFTYTQEQNGKTILIKELRSDTEADSLGNEAQFTQVLNKISIGPKFISFDGKKLVREFVDGERIEEFLEHASESQARNIITDVFKQCQKMDSLRINKFEMTNPYKHILITQDAKPIMIDFERCKYTEKPKNVTQFAQYVIKPGIVEKLTKANIIVDREKILKLTTEYKHHNYSIQLFQEILNLFGGEQ